MRPYAIVLFVVCLLPCRLLYAAEVYLGLQAYGGSGKALGIGLAPFTASSPDSESNQLAKSLRSVMREDILFTRLFSVSEGGPAASEKLDSMAWSGLGAQVVVTAVVKADGPDVHMECRIFDVSSGKVLWGKVGTGPKLNARRLAHVMSDQLTFQLSGQPGIARSHIVFGNNHTGNKEIYVMDYDGANVRQLTHMHSITLLPKVSPDGKWIAFNSYKAGNPDAYLMDLNGGNLQELSTRQGLNTSPNWAPDGKSLALTLSRGGDPELYLLERSGVITRRLTYAKGVDTSPGFSPNGQQIVFISDRAGNPELYVMDATGAGVTRLTYGQWTDAPAWSPRGDWIAYERQRTQGRFDIYMIEPSGRNAHLISEAGARNENPSWSPDGRFLAYASDRDGQTKICTMGADGSSPHCLTPLPGESFTPSWGL